MHGAGQTPVDATPSRVKARTQSLALSLSLPPGMRARHKPVEPTTEIRSRSGLTPNAPERIRTSELRPRKGLRAPRGNRRTLRRPTHLSGVRLYRRWARSGGERAT